MAKKVTGYLKLQVPAGAAILRPRSVRAWSAVQHHGILQVVQRADEKEKNTPIR
jgi:hypothetical protein